MKCSCKGCNERHPACHDACEKYKEYKAYVDAVRKADQDSVAVFDRKPLSIAMRKIAKRKQRMARM